jgi:hypothetical protein
MEAHAPAAAEHAVVALHQRRERVPRRLVQRLDGVGGLVDAASLASLKYAANPAKLF